MSSLETSAINGNPAALAFDRAVDELRRGRAIQVTAPKRGLLVAAVEAIQESQFARLLAAGPSRPLLFVTTERALAAGLTHQLSGPVAVAIPRGDDIELLRAVA